MNISRQQVPNVTLRLLDRELTGARGAPVHTARSFSECISPNAKVLEVESPDAHIGRFTPDGNYLVCFSLQLQAVLLFEYLGPTPHLNLQDISVGFNSFFKERWRLNLCDGSEQLSRDFCLTLCNGSHLLLASSTPVRRQGPPAAAADGPGVVVTDIGGQDVQPQPQQQQQQQQRRRGQQAVDDVQGEVLNTAVAANGGDGVERNARAASDDWCEMTTFHVVDIRRCMKVDERRYPSDYFELAGNACASLCDNMLALTSLYTQSIHLLQVSADGSLIDMQTIGQMCQADDALPVQLAAAAEQQWQLQCRQQQEKEQQDRMELAAQQRLLLRMLEVQRQQQQQQQLQQQQQEMYSSIVPEQQQQSQQVNVQQQLLQQVTHPNSLWGQAAAAAMGASAVNSTGNAAAAAAAARHESRPSGDDSSSDEEMSRRERRRRVPAALAQQQQQQQQQRQQQPAGDEQGPGAHIIGQQHPNGRQQQQQQAGAPHGPPTRASAVAASAAAATAVLDTQHQLIEGLQQRLLTYLYKSILSQQANEVAPSMWDFQYNFGVFSGLVVFRARLVDCQHLLLKLAARTTGPASSAELNPSRMHFFAVYNIVTTRFEGFWRASNSRLLSAVMSQPSQLLAAGGDLNPWERCSAAALYPQGYPVGLGSSSRRQQQQVSVSSADGSSRTGGRRSAAAAGGSRGGLLQSGQDAALQHQQQASTTAAVNSELAGDSLVESAAAAAGSGDSKAARDRLKLLRQVVLLVLPGLQNLSSSPYLDPHLFTYSKHISPIMGLRNSPTDSLKFRLARSYQRLGHGTGETSVQHEAKPSSSQQGTQQHNSIGTQRRQEVEFVLELDPARPHSVTWVNEEVARRQLHLFHPGDPFVLTVVQTIAQPAVVSICYRF